MTTKFIRFISDEKEGIETAINPDHIVSYQYQDDKIFIYSKERGYKFCNPDNPDLPKLLEKDEVLKPEIYLCIETDIVGDADVGRHYLFSTIAYEVHEQLIALGV